MGQLLETSPLLRSMKLVTWHPTTNLKNPSFVHTSSLILFFTDKFVPLGHDYQMGQERSPHGVMSHARYVHVTPDLVTYTGEN